MSYPDRSTDVLVTSAVFLGAATLFVGLRCISKFGIRKRADSDDWVTILAWLFTVALSISIIFAATVGLGKPDDLIKPEWQEPLKRAVYVFPIFYHLSSMTAKSAALLLYIRMASAHPFLRNASYAVLAIVDVSGVVLVFMNIFQCRPLAAAWQWDQSGQCFDLVTLFLASSPINILSDLAILILPLPIITGLRIERKEKIGLVLAFLCGVFVAIVDVVRIAYLQTALKEQISLGRDHVSASDRPTNYYWYTSYGLMWSAVECSVRVCCLCALVLKPLLQKLRRGGSSVHSGGSKGVFSKRSAHSAGNGELGVPAGTAVEDAIFGSPKSPQMKLGGIQAMLEPSAEVPEEDTFDIMAFFAAGPGEPASPRIGTGALSTSPRMGFANGNAHGSGNGNGAEFGLGNSPSSSDSAMGAPLITLPTRISTHHFITAPVRWITKESEPPELAQAPTQRFFDVVQMGGRKPLTELTPREAWWPVMFVSILFFLWGFSYGLLGNLTTQIMAAIEVDSPSRSIALQNAYWIGYLIGPLTAGAYVLPHHGFKATFMTGLVIYACGTMAFWPSAVLASYGGFFFCNIVIGMGLSVLEVAANPFIALAGPGELSECRLNFSQGIQAVGSVISPIIANKWLFKNVSGRMSLFDIQWYYLAVALFVLFLALVFFYVPLAEATDDELETETVNRLDRAGLTQDAKAFKCRVPARWFAIIAGIFVLTFYVGAQESLAYFWTPYIKAIGPPGGTGDPFWDLTIGHGLFAASRFIAAGVCYMGFTPRLILNVCCTGTFLSSLLAVVLKDGQAAFACILLTLFFEGPVFPTLFATVIRGMGRRTKQVSIALTASIGFVAVWQTVTWAVWRDHGVRQAYIVVVVLCFFQALYPIALASSPTLRRWVDPKWSRDPNDPHDPRRPSMGSGSVGSKPLHVEHADAKHHHHVNGRDHYHQHDTRVTVDSAMSTPPDADADADDDDAPPDPSHPALMIRRQSARTPPHYGPDVPVVGVGIAPIPPAEGADPTMRGPTDDFAGLGVVGELEEL